MSFAARGEDFPTHNGRPVLNIGTGGHGYSARRGDVAMLNEALRKWADGETEGMSAEAQARSARHRAEKIEWQRRGGMLSARNTKRKEGGQ